MAKVGLISLGCPKNTVDAEEILGEVAKAGHEIEVDPACADVLIVNTCGFIKSAKEESIEAILDAVRYKTNGACRSVIVTGCLAQRYGDELSKEIPEADGFISLGKSRDIPGIIDSTLNGKRVVDLSSASAWWKESRDRVLSTPGWTAYLRVADGCDNRCTYCAIPLIRGGFASRSESDILDEAKVLVDLGVKELNLVAQDVTRYGFDTEGSLRLHKLIDRLSELDGLHWIRLLYCYPTRITDELITIIAENNKVCKYIDVPLQHCSDNVLKMMSRHGSRQEYLDLFDRIKAKCPEIALRTSFIVGFPGETDEDFNSLMDFASAVKFDRAGVFRYSREDGTPAASMENQISRRIADSRYSKFMALQQKISMDKNRQFVGSHIEVLVESRDNTTLIGRSYRDAPDIDGLVYIKNVDRDIHLGEFVDVEILDAEHYDLIGRLV
ncbi:MAG: 30S ribosomal protein S12 methylthiotransferase RimO [Armatimonadota bacterium]